MKHNATTNAGPRDGFQDKLLQLIYNHALGRALILPFTHPVISKIGGYCMDSSLSVPPTLTYPSANRLRAGDTAPLTTCSPAGCCPKPVPLTRTP